MYKIFYEFYLLNEYLRHECVDLKKSTRNFEQRNSTAENNSEQPLAGVDKGLIIVMSDCNQPDVSLYFWDMSIIT